MWVTELIPTIVVEFVGYRVDSKYFSPRPVWSSSPRESGNPNAMPFIRVRFAKCTTFDLEILEKSGQAGEHLWRRRH